jgi:hypothetical protein
MAIKYKRNSAVFQGTVGVEEAEVLLAWIQKHPKGTLNFESCTHVHAAQLQVLMAARIMIAQWPQDEFFGTWLKSALDPQTRTL